MKYSEYFGTKRRLSFKNENIRYDILNTSCVSAWQTTANRAKIGQISMNTYPYLYPLPYV